MPYAVPAVSGRGDAVIAKEEDEMKVILLTEVKNKGGEGDVVDVAPGFANNYLLPQGMAVLATKGNLEAARAAQAQHRCSRREPHC